VCVMTVCACVHVCYVFVYLCVMSQLMSVRVGEFRVRLQLGIDVLPMVGLRSSRR